MVATEFVLRYGSAAVLGALAGWLLCWQIDRRSR